MMEGNQQSFQQLNFTDCNYEEEAIQCQFNTIFLQKYFVNVQLKKLVQEVFKAAEFFLQRAVLHQ